MIEQIVRVIRHGIDALRPLARGERRPQPQPVYVVVRNRPR